MSCPEYHGPPTIFSWCMGCGQPTKDCKCPPPTRFQVALGWCEEQVYRFRYWLAECLEAFASRLRGDRP